MDNISALNSASSGNIGVANYNNLKAENELNSFSSSLDQAMTSKEDEKMMDACIEFESYFIQHMYKEMQKTVDDSNSMFKSQASDTFKDFLVQETAKDIAQAGGIGIADSMYKSMQEHQTALEDPVNQIDIQI